MSIKSVHFMRVALFFPMALALLLYFLPNNFELYPRVGWVDAGMYTGYANNENLIKDYGFSGHNYQGSRLGYIVPAKIFSTIFDPLLGRYFFVIFYYLATLAALISLVRDFSKRLDIQSFFLTTVICNPLLLAGLSYGGADGPTATYIIISAAFLFKSTQSKNANIYLALASIFAALSFSTHVLSVAPLGLILISYFISQQNNFKDRLIVIGLAFLATIVCLSFVGHYLGIEKNYLTYSLGWGVQSVKGIGGQFTHPIQEVITHSLIYLPPLALFCTVLIFFKPISALKHRTKNWHILASIILSAGPLLFFILYDKLLNGTISQYLSYYQLLYPCFILSFLFILTAKDLSISKHLIITINTALTILFIFTIYNIALKYAVMLIVVITGAILLLSIKEKSKLHKTTTACLLVGVVSVQLLLYVHNNSVKPFFHLVGGANTEELYKSQLEFMNSVNNIPRAYGLPLFIYESAKNENGLLRGQFYHTYFGGRKNIYTYFDSLTALNLWDRSILSRDPFLSDFASEIDSSDHSRPIVILGKNNDEVNKIYNRILPFKPDFKTIASTCYQSSYYPWCITVARDFPNKGQEK